jgi:cobalt-zinc-cadmium efflux system membrane fusion protein
MNPRLLAAPTIGLAALLGYQATLSSGSLGKMAVRGATPPRAEASASGIEVAPDAGCSASSTILTIGRVTFDETRVAHVVSPVSGSVARVEARLGEGVGEGTPLAVISSGLANALSDEITAQADLAAAESDYQRQLEFYRVRAETQAEFESARAARRQARAALARARERVSLLQLGDRGAAPRETIVRAPITGRVLAVGVSLGEEVAGQRGSRGGRELFTVGDLSSVWVVADVAETDLASIRVGTSVWVTVPGAFSGRRLTGRVVWISAAVDPWTCTTMVRCVVDNPDETLKPGIEATVSIAATP